MDIRGFLKLHTTLVVFVIIVSVSSVSLLFSSSSFAGQGSSLLGVLQSGVSSVGRFFTETVDSVRQLGQLREDYDALLERVRSAEVLEQDIESLRRENERLRNVLDFSESFRYEHIPARIVGRDPQSLFATITINRGSQHGIQRDSPVVAVQEGLESLVGRVVEVGAFSSRVQPVTQPGSFVSAMISESRHQGLAAGTGSGVYGVELRHIPQSAADDIVHGATVVTSGLQSLYPQGILIGRVQGIQSHPFEPTLQLPVRPFVDLSRLEYLFVIQPEGSQI
ncbi:MAG: rod shape-determining protein MreC [Spirochaetaceae bacterium]|nr:MAG: rod shape-determining protein MreC [Spirochaetaceae bacterium]